MSGKKVSRISFVHAMLRQCLTNSGAVLLSASLLSPRMTLNVHSLQDHSEVEKVWMHFEIVDCCKDCLDDGKVCIADRGYRSKLASERKAFALPR